MKHVTLPVILGKRSGRILTDKKHQKPLVPWEVVGSLGSGWFSGNGYMLKFPPASGRNKAISYTDSCISEYLACHVFNIPGIPAQETLLGTYTDRKGKKKVVVACLDFTAGGKKLMEFARLKNTCINSGQNGYGTELPGYVPDTRVLKVGDKKIPWAWKA